VLNTSFLAECLFNLVDLFCCFLLAVLLGINWIESVCVLFSVLFGVKVLQAFNDAYVLDIYILVKFFNHYLNVSDYRLF